MRALARLLCAVALPCLASCTPPAAAEPATPHDATAARDSLFAPHRKGDRFFNPWSTERRGVLDFLRWRLSRNPYDKSAPLAVPTVANDGKGLAGVEHSASVTWIGHATVAVHEDGDLFLTDPHFGPRALIVPRLVPPGIPVEAIPPHAFAVVSHNHYDHLDAWSVERLPAEMRWFVPLGLADWFRDRGRHNVVELDWWQSARHGRFTVTCLPSQHWSRRIEQGENESLWCSWLVDSGKRRYYHAGDTGWFHGFAEFGRRYGPIDLAILPIGAWEPRWFMRDQHLDPAEAYRAFVDLRAKHMVGMHWGTFDLTDEPADLAPRVLAEEVAKAGGDASRVKTLAIGERWRIPDEPEPR